MGRTESVIKRLNIVYGAYKRGFIARCPNPDHNDRNPSWSIREDGMHSCWSCGFRGDIYALVSAVLGCSFFEAKVFAGDPDRAAPEPILPVEIHIFYNTGLSVPEGVEFPEVGEWPYSVQSYLTQRQITQAQAVKWGLGYAKEGPLSGRVFIPYQSRMGDLISYTARSYVGSTPKYKKPSPQENALKTALFGEQYWPTLKKWLVVTEGELNALAVERAIQVPVAALSGSNLSPTHAAKIIQFPNVLCLTDSDKAGDKAADKLFGSLVRHTNVKRLRLPNNTDANDISRESLRAQILSAMGAA